MKNPFTHIKKTVAAQLETNVPGYAQTHFLLAVSGGPDSVLLAHIFHHLKLSFSIAHVNYGLRGKDSGADERFVEALADTLDVSCFIKKAPIKKTNAGGKSIQMQAREIRYAFFDAILKEQNSILVLAHHANDQVETVLLNFFRGCGIDGLTGMKTMEGKKLRPLLNVFKNEILAALEEKKIPYRTDKSNKKDDYKRNFLRNRVVPQLQEKWPGIVNTILENTERLNLVANALHQQKTTKHILFDKDFSLNTTELSADLLLAETFMKQAVQNGFHLKELRKLLQNKKNNETKKLVGKTGQIERKGPQLNFILNKPTGTPAALDIKGNQISIKIPATGFLRHAQERINAHTIKGPLQLRLWKNGDKMVPLGMKGFKKISDLLTDLKLSTSQKNQVYVLCDQEKIVWLVGFRIDNRVKLNGKEKKTEILSLSIN